MFNYLVELGVDKKHRLTAFRLIRDKDFNPMVRKIFYLRHSETHVLYITSVVCFIGLLVRLIAWFLKIPYCNTAVLILILVVGLVSLAAGLFSDKKLCADECYYSKLNEDKIKQTLKEAKLIDKK